LLDDSTACVVIDAVQLVEPVIPITLPVDAL